MGTGIVSVLLHNLPYNAAPVRWIAVGLFVLNVVLFAVFALLSLVRYLLYPEIWTVMIRHPVQSLFLGCIPMGFATIINMLVFVCAPSWGSWVVYLAWALWWVDAMVSCACSLIIPFIVLAPLVFLLASLVFLAATPSVHHHRNKLDKMTAALLLPVVPVVVASATGGIVAEVLPNPFHAIATLVVSYILWGLGQAFSFFIMAIYFLRLQLHDMPPREVIVSVFLPIGPLGQGGFAIQQLGLVALDLPLLPRVDSPTPGLVLYTIGVFAAMVMWGAALGWLALALFSIATTKSFPFNMGWWGFTFPLGVFTTCTSLLATELSSPFFKVMTMIFSGSVVLLWLVVAIKTVHQAIKGDMFFAPCLKDLRPKTAQAGGDRTV